MPSTKLEKHENAGADSRLFATGMGATDESKNQKHPDAVRFDRGLFAVCLIFPALLSLWFTLDHSWPFWDAADHVRVEFEYADLLKHARPWNLHWIKDFLTVNYCYPATVHIFNGALKAILGNARWVDSLSLVIWACLLSFSTCATALLLLRNKAAAALSVVLINMYPCVALLSHVKLLDFPHLSMFTAAMLSLVWWEKKPGWARAALCGTALGLACTTKQIAPFFLFSPCLLSLITQLKNARWERALQLTCAGLMVLLFVAIWVVPNAAEINAYMNRNAGQLGSRTVWTAFVPNLLGYINCGPGLFGYPLLLLAVLSLFTAGKKQLKELALPAVSAITGILCMAALPFQLPEHRYIANALLFPALLCSAQICRLYNEKKQIAFWLFTLLAGAGSVQFIVQNFGPYPLGLPSSLTRAILGLQSDRRGPLEPSFNPTPPGDIWGQLWVVHECMKASGNQVCWLNMLPSTPEISVHTIALIGKYEGSQIRPTTTRLWTPAGDKITIDGGWSNFQFYLLKTGAQGLHFDTSQSQAEYRRLEQLVSTSPLYRLVGQRTIQDGTTLSLYGRCDYIDSMKPTESLPQTESAVPAASTLRKSDQDTGSETSARMPGAPSTRTATVNSVTNNRQSTDHAQNRAQKQGGTK